jgi:hypothetical protein
MDIHLGMKLLRVLIRILRCAENKRWTAVLQACGHNTAPP